MRARTAPSVGVCIPVAGDPADLRDTLESIVAFRPPLLEVQVVVGIDGPDPTLAQVAASYGADAVALDRNRGSYAARNAAVAALLPSVAHVLFTDADCCVSQAWFTAHVAALERGAGLSAGGIRFRMSSPPRPAEWVDRVRHLDQKYFAEERGFGATANLAVRREVLQAVTFDESLRSGGDFDFCRRAAERGFDLVYTDAAWVTHPARATARAVLRKVARVARGTRTIDRTGADASGGGRPNAGSAVERARAEGLGLGRSWQLRVAVLELFCRVTLVAFNPRFLWRAVRRRLVRG